MLDKFWKPKKNERTVRYKIIGEKICIRRFVMSNDQEKPTTHIHHPITEPLTQLVKESGKIVNRGIDFIEGEIKQTKDIVNKAINEAKNQ